MKRHDVGHPNDDALLWHRRGRGQNNKYDLIHVQSCAYSFRYSLFQDSEETIHNTEINTTSYEPPWCFSSRKNKKKFFEHPNNQKLKN